VGCTCKTEESSKTANAQADYTFAISVTTPPDAIVVAAPPPLVTVSDLEVALAVKAGIPLKMRAKTGLSREQHFQQ
jgi:hypothetical protein